MNVNKILKDEIDLIKVDKNTFDNINNTSKSFCEELKRKLKKGKIKADVFIGGSLAKNTLIKRHDGKYDVDIFVRFSVEYDEKKISSILEKVLGNWAEKVHGSRDYYQTVINGITIEIIPVLKIKNPSQSENVTDLSYFHVNHVSKCIKKNKKIGDEIRLAKAFSHAHDCYGAESYIKGFSGYALELLICHYKSFLKFVKAVALAKDREKIIIDDANFYKNKKDILVEMNESKIHSHIILIDPTYKERNALAGLSDETFKRFKKACQDFLKNPDFESFEKKGVFDEFKNLKNLIIISVKTNKQKGDIAGTKSKKFFKFFINKLKREFAVEKSGFDYDEDKNVAYFYLILKNKEREIVRGPAITNVLGLNGFKKVHPDAFIKNGFAYVSREHKLTSKEWLKKFLEKDKSFIESMSVKEIRIVD